MNIEKQIEFDKIKEIWKNLCITDKAKELIDSGKAYEKLQEFVKATQEEIGI